MPVLFHTGASTVFHFDFRKFNLNPLWMTPGTLMRVAMYFLDMVMVLAHMGNVQVHDACAVARSKNVFLDTSGGSALKELPKSAFDHIVYWPYVQDKLMWGSDQWYHWIGDELEKNRRFVEKVGLSDGNQELLWHGNAEKIIAYVDGDDLQ